VLGGVARITCGWAVVAYVDRTHLFLRPHLVTDLDDVPDLPDAVMALITHWRRIDRPPILLAMRVLTIH
jgi:hypothetical protein